MVECVEIEYYHVRSDLVRSVARTLQRGGLVACPTDTTYGVFASPHDQGATERLNRLREQMSGGDDAAILAVHEKPLAFVFADFDQLIKWAVLPGLAFKVVKRLFPGPFTIILPAHRSVPKKLQSKRRHLGVRIPDHPIVQAIVAAFGAPVLSTTAKTRDGELIEDAIVLSQEWKHEIDMVVDAGPIVPEPSTVLAFEHGEVVVVREGRGLELL